MTTKVIIRDMRADMLIGIKDHEKKNKQPVVINVVASIRDNPDWGSDEIENTVSYSPMISGVRQIIARGHINLIETFAEHIAALCLQDGRVEEVTVRVEKTKVYDDVGSVAVEIARRQASYS